MVDYLIVIMLQYYYNVLKLSNTLSRMHNKKRNIAHKNRAQLLQLFNYITTFIIFYKYAYRNVTDRQTDRGTNRKTDGLNNCYINMAR